MNDLFLVKQLLDLPMPPNDVDAKTVGQYLQELLLAVWQKGEAFSGKRPFGNSGWKYPVYSAMISAGFAKGTLDEYEEVSEIDSEDADKTIVAAIRLLFNQYEADDE